MQDKPSLEEVEGEGEVRGSVVGNLHDCVIHTTSVSHA